jgi:hypothetical protein
MRRAVPAFVLFFLAPLVAEFFLGDFPLTQLWLLLVLAPIYGGGALLIREVTRRTGRGWPTIVLLALAYGVLEEGLITQSLFNPGYLDAHLLDQGFVPALGIAIPWTIFVLALHTIWSISTPIALVEESTGPRRTTPWLGKAGLTVTAVLLVVGCFAVWSNTKSTEHFTASTAQVTISLAVIVALVVAAFLMPRPSAAADAGGRAPVPWTVFVATLVAGGLFMAADKASEHLPTWLDVAFAVVALVGIAVLVARWSARPGWGPWHRFAAASGAVLTYTWRAFTSSSVGDSSAALDLVSHIVYAAAAVAILWYAARRIRHHLAARRTAPSITPTPAAAVP